MYCTDHNCSILLLNLFRDLMTLSITQPEFTISGQIFTKYLILRGYKLRSDKADLRFTVLFIKKIYQIQANFSR